MSKKLLTAAADSLLSDEWEENDYGAMVSDGAAIERLLKMKDFEVYQRKMTVELALLMKKSMTADSDAARTAIQGALLQQMRVLKLPADIVARAAKAVANKRQDDEGTGDNP